MQKIVCPNYLFCSFNKRGSLEPWEEFTEHQLGDECSHRIPPSIKVIQLHEIVSITGSRTAESN